MLLILFISEPKCTFRFNKQTRTLTTPTHFYLCANGCPYIWGVYLCMGAYKHNVVVVIKIGAILILCGRLFRFHGMSALSSLSALNVVSIIFSH